MNYQYPIVEMFDSIQGEGYNIGTPATFIRLAGCNLKCPWCDTKWDVASQVLTATEIAEKVNYNNPMIVITGGEPFMHNVVPLVEAIRDIDKDILIAFETNGTFNTTHISRYYSNIFVACSPKPDNQWKINPGCIYDELKYVIDDQITLKDIKYDCELIWLQPQGFNMKKSWQKCLEFAQKEPQRLRVGVQLHKIMEVR